MQQNGRTLGGGQPASLLKHLLKVEGVAAEMTGVSPAAGMCPRAKGPSASNSPMIGPA